MEKCPSLGWSEEAHCSQYHDIFSWPTQSSMSSTFHPHRYPSSSSEAVEDTTAVASKSHSQAEKRRRERINGHLSTLRRLIPRSDKMDKAALLGSVVNHVNELKRRANDVGKLYTVPTDVDEVSVDYDSDKDAHIGNKTDNNKDYILFKASVCCEDRPELFNDINQALKGLKLRTLKADMATLGGRIINVMILCSNKSEEGVCLTSLKQSIKVVLSRVASLSMPSVSEFSSKRRRMLMPTNYSHFSV